MKNTLKLILLTALSCVALQTASASRPDALRFTLIKTSGTTTLDALTYSGGSWFSTARVNHVAVLVEHPQGRFLFDTGLGRHIDEQYDEDMPLWMRPSFSYDPATPARDQLDEAHILPPARIILSHAHWDHASGVPDFPNAEVWIRPSEHAYIPAAPNGPVMHSQFDAENLRWHEYQLENKPWRNFSKSLDLFGDGSTVLVDQGGHTPGSVGLYLRSGSGREFLLCGDTVWRTRAVKAKAPKNWLARWIVDSDADATYQRVEQLFSFSKANPDVMIVPAHDAEVQDQLGYFPAWVD